MPRDPNDVGRAGTRDTWRDVVLVPLVVCVVTVVAYLALLGWDQQKTLGADGYQHGPYEAWQVVATVGVLGVLAAWCGWRGRVLMGSGVGAAVFTVVWSVDAATNSESDGLWPVGAALVAVGTGGGFLLVAALTNRARGSRSGPRR